MNCTLVAKTNNTLDTHFYMAHTSARRIDGFFHPNTLSSPYSSSKRMNTPLVHVLTLDTFDAFNSVNMLDPGLDLTEIDWLPRLSVGSLTEQQATSSQHFAAKALIHQSCSSVVPSNSPTAGKPPFRLY